MTDYRKQKESKLLEVLDALHNLLTPNELFFALQNGRYIFASGSGLTYEGAKEIIDRYYEEHKEDREQEAVSKRIHDATKAFVVAQDQLDRERPDFSDETFEAMRIAYEELLAALG
jgi:hypothetical protein